jgi:hypothetical protein
MLITEHADGKGSFVHEPVQYGDGIRHSLGVDGGEGSSDSLKLLRDESASQAVDGLLPREAKSIGPERGSSGRCVSKAK